MNGVALREADRSDAQAVAMLHVDSWRRHYRGAYADAYLDGDVVSDRLRVWSERLAADDHTTATIVAEQGTMLVGFAHVQFEADPRWGALLDNLHVAKDVHRQGVGTRLVRAAAASVTARPVLTGLFLWVLEQNVAAQAFYDAVGGRRVDLAHAGAPLGDPANLVGTPRKLRYVWPDPRDLCVP